MKPITDTDIPHTDTDTDIPHIPYTEPILIPGSHRFFYTDTDTGFWYLVSVSYRVSVKL